MRWFQKAPQSNGIEIFGQGLLGVEPDSGFVFICFTFALLILLGMIKPAKRTTQWGLYFLRLFHRFQYSRQSRGSAEMDQAGAGRLHLLPAVILDRAGRSRSYCMARCSVHRAVNVSTNIYRSQMCDRSVLN